MNTASVYLTFNGNCEKAFRFYETVFQSEIEYLGRMRDMPDLGEHQIPDEHKDRVMHVTLPIGGTTFLYGSDTAGDWDQRFKPGNNFSIYVHIESQEEADRIFNELAVGGEIITPIEDSFWGSYFGMLTDKFGIQWMVSYVHPQNG